MSGHNNGAVLEGKVCRRGTSNGNDRGSSYDRRRRREYLVETYRADVDLLRYEWAAGDVSLYPITPEWEHLEVGAVGYESALAIVARISRVATCRCYRCGCLLTVDTVTVDRIKPGCKGGTYRRENIRPACGGCNSETGGALASHPARSAS